MDEVAVVQEDVAMIRIVPTTPGTVLTSDIFLSISAVPIGMLFRKTGGHMLAVNVSMQSLVSDAVTTVHAGNVAVAEDNIY